ncbi:NUDIX domain-containing protein [Microbacterium gorillae]|uniref:NUDIX domain-containing protein n=1 Tax=Microbacterium gorillae TaxID=1231063 RepID=UPI00058E50BE|nr:NUDIX hydrolase [Microbacterium gorillae]
MTDLRDEAFEPEVIRRERVFAGYIWDVVSETFRYGDAELTREFIEHPGAAAVVALDAEERVMALQQYRHPIRTRDWELPAGILDVPGEDPRDAAARELAEEADLAADRWDRLVSVHTTPGGNSELIHVYLARDLRPVKTDFVRTGEEADMRRAWIPLGEVIDAVLSGAMCNGILATGALAAAELLRRERAH